MGIADQVFMQEALVCARQAEISGEVPIGAVLVYENEIIGRGFNSSIQLNDPTAHAEMMALRAGAATIGNYRLINTTLYVTLEPCMMCVGAIVHARVKHLVFGASDPKAGAVMSQCQGLEHAFLNHRTTFAAGLMAEACAMVLRNFFRAKR